MRHSDFLTTAPTSVVLEKIHRTFSGKMRSIEMIGASQTDFKTSLVHFEFFQKSSIHTGYGIMLGSIDWLSFSQWRNFVVVNDD